MQRLFTICSSHVAGVSRHSVTETVIQKRQVYASREVVLAVSHSGYVLDGIFSCFGDYNEHRNVI